MYIEAEMPVLPNIRVMKPGQRWRIILLMSCVFVGINPVFSQSKYVKKYKPLVDSLSKAYGIPSCIIFGVAILESGSGTSRNAKLLNNHFGIIGKNNLMVTKGVKSRYKQYTSVAGSYVDFCKLLARKKYYKKLKDNKDCSLWVEAISKAGYSTVPEEWKKRVLATIRKNKLDAP